MCCEVDGGSCAGADGLGSDEQPAATAASDEARKREQNAELVSSGFSLARSCFMTFSVYLPPPIRSSVASAITLVAFTRSSMRHYSSG